jgi:hypothetical protein
VERGEGPMIILRCIIEILGSSFDGGGVAGKGEGKGIE